MLELELELKNWQELQVVVTQELQSTENDTKSFCWPSNEKAHFIFKMFTEFSTY